MKGLNSDLLDGLDSSSFVRADGDPLTAEVHSSTTQDAENLAGTTLTADTETYDPADLHADGSSDVVAPRAGTYIVSATVTWDGSTDGYRRTALVAGGREIASVAGLPLVAPAFTSQNAGGLTHLDRGQVVSVEVLQGSGDTLGVRLDALEVTWVGP